MSRLRPCRVVLSVFLGLSCVVAWHQPVRGQNVSAAPLLQFYEARWDVIEDRMVDIFTTGYGGLWLPPPNRADSGGLSVGYDVFDRFDFGSARNETLYGTEDYFRRLVDRSHQAGLRVHTDLILNHNGFRDSSTPGFEAEGDYPGFVLSLPNDPDGDFHGRFETGEELFRLSGLIDIAQEKNHQFIRHPVADDPLNIPSGSIHDQPDPRNARFYPDQDLGGTQVWHPGLNQNVTLYDFNTSSSLAGDAVPDNATGLLMRNIRWMIQDMGVDGFRLDAGRHFPRWVLDFFDQASFRAKQTPLLDGSPDHVFSFTETGYGSNAFLQDFIKKDIDNNNLGQV
ncbi:MAG: alpha-amylase family glycosyl hydrolase, partial [Planctomycetota bacterium]